MTSPGILEKSFESILRLALPSDNFFPLQPFSLSQLDYSYGLGGVFIPCENIHGNSCFVDSLLTIVRKIAPVAKTYGIIHIAQFLVFKRKHLRGKECFNEIGKLIVGWIKSVCFLMFVQYAGKLIWCYGKQANLFGHGLDSNITLLLSPIAYISILLERGTRQQEIAMYVLPKYLESIVPFLSKTKLMITIPHFNKLLLALSVGIIVDVLNRDPLSIKRQFLWITRLILGGSDAEEVEEEKIISYSTGAKLCPTELIDTQK